MFGKSPFQIRAIIEGAKRNLQVRNLLLLGTIAVGGLVLLYFSRPALAATSTTWTGAAGINWNDPGNWDTGVPGSGDLALFNSGSNPATINVDINVGGIQITSGYAGTITQASGVAIHLTGAAFPCGPRDTFSFCQSGGTFITGSGDTFVDDNFTISGGTFTAATGTVIFDGQFGATFDVPGSIAFNNLTFSGPFNVNGSDTFTVNGTLNLTSGFLSGNDTIDAKGNVSIDPSFNSSHTGSALLLISGSTPRTITLPVGADPGAFTVNSASVTLNTSGAGTITFARAVNFQSAASITNGPVNFIFNSTFDIATSFTPGSGNLTFNNPYTQTGGTFTAGSGVLDFNSSFTLNGGTFVAPAGSATFGNFFVGSGGTFNPNGGTIIIDVAGATIDAPGAGGTLTFNNLTLNAPVNIGIVSDSDTFIINGTLNLLSNFTNGSAGSTLQARGDMIVQSGFTGGSANISFGGSANQTYTNNGGTNPIGTWTVDKPARAVTLASDLSLQPLQPLNITQGVLDQGASFNLTAGPITVGSAGRLQNRGTGDLTLTGNVTNNGIINFNGGGIANCGDPDSILIRSSVNGLQRTWSGGGSFSMQDVDVKDQMAGNPPLITAFSSTDSGNNTNWTFDAGCNPTEVTLESFTATGYEDGKVLLEWHTGFEVRNLGFNVYREEGGTQVRINPSMLAGSALVTGLNTRLTAGWSYSWIDKTAGDKRSAEYWLEDVDLKGQSTLHGPIRSQRSEVRGQKSEVKPQSATLSEIGNRESPDTSLPLERKAQPAELTAESIQAQAALALQPAAKIAVKREGWYRITQAQLDAAGFNTKVDPRLLQLFVDGSELPIIVSGEQDGRFDSTDSIEFYGIGLDSPFTDSRVYWLVVGNQNGLRVNQAKTDGTPASSQSFTANVERHDRTIYFSGLRNGEKENFFGAVIAREPVYQQLTLSHLARADSSDNQLEITLQGVTVTDHRVSVELNGAHIGEVVFNGQSQGTARFNVSNSLLREGNNVVQLAPLAGGSDVSLVDYLRISYQHSYSADNDALKLTGPGRQQVTIDGFTSKSVRVFDVTDPNSPQELIGEIEQQALGYAATFASPREGQRVFIALTNEQPPASVTLNQPSSLHKGKASFIIITRRELADSLKPLVALRERQGLRVALVDIEDIYDEFSFGQKTPFAVRDFLAFAKSNWKKKPRFVLFAGDASHDPKNYLGFGDLDFVSTKLIDTDFMETSSDDWFSDFDGDGIADLATGRLPARTAEELSSMVAKIIGYEQSGPADEVLLVADANDGFNFEQASSDLLSLIPPSLRITQVNRGRLDPEMARRSLFEALYRKQFLVNYVGHGSVNQWRANLLTNDDALALGNEHLPIFVMMTCLNGYFADPALDSLGEALMKAERGGAIAVWASSGMTMPRDQALLNQELYRLLFNRGQSITIGEAVMRVKNSLSSSDVRRTWILLGDPTMKLK